MSSTSHEPNGILRRNSNWQLALGVVAVLIPLTGLLCGGAWWIYTVGAQVTTLQASIQDITRQTERTNSERQALSKQAEENKDLISVIRQELSQETATRKAMMIEIETQVASVEQVRNMQNAELHRLLSIIWPKELGMYPQGPHVHPAISNRNLKE